MLIKIKDVCRILNISRNTLYSLKHKDSTFPKPLKFGDKMQSRIYYNEKEIQDWIINLKDDKFYFSGEENE